MRVLDLRQDAAERRWVVPLGSVIIGVVGVAGWAVLSYSPLGFVVASPIASVSILMQELIGAEAMIGPHAVSTFSSVITGYALAVLVGLILGVLLGISWYWRTVWEPILLSAYSIPKIVLFPILLFALGIGFRAQVAMSFIYAVFPIIMNVMAGIKEVNPTHIKVAQSLQANLLQTVTKVYFPSTALSLVVGLRMGFCLSILGVIISELVASREGLGRLIMRRYAVMDIGTMFAAILLIFLVAFIGNMLFWLLEKKLRGTR